MVNLSFDISESESESRFENTDNEQKYFLSKDFSLLVDGSYC